MRRTFTLVMVAMLIAVGWGPATSATAQSQSVDVWVEVGTSRPAPGCVVGASVEVRSSGGAVSDANISLTLSNDEDSTIYSAESGLTDGSGIVQLSFDTSAASSGAKTWLEVAVNSSYMGGRTIWVDGSGCSGAPSILDLSGDAPTVTENVIETSAPSESSASNGAVIIPGVNAYQQQRPLSCEFAAVSIATGALGSWVSEYDIEAATPLSANPHWGYRGNINGSWGNTDDYGIYADGLVAGLNQFGFQSNVFYGENGDLIASIDQGRPTLVWLGMWGDLSHDEYTSDGTRYQLTQAMHVMVAYGYDDGGVYLSDPGSGTFRYYDWATFNEMWQAMDGMAMGISW